MAIDNTNNELDIEFDIASIGDLPDAETVETSDTLEDIEEQDTGKEDVPDTVKDKVKVPEIPDITKDSPEEKTEDSKDDAPEMSLIEEIVAQMGYDDLGEDFEESTEGLIKLTNALSERRATETLDELFNSMPTLKQHFEYLRSGGDPNAFMETVKEPDWSTMAVDEKNAKDVLRSYFKARGDEDAFIDDMIEAYEDKKQLTVKAEQAKEALAKVQEKKREQLVEAQKEQAELERKKSEEIWNTVKSTVMDSTELAGIPITEREKAKFIEFISAPVDAKGNTQRDVMASQLKLEQQLALDYLIFKGVDLKKFVDIKAGTKNAMTLRDRLKSGGKVKGGKSVSTGSSQSAGENLTLDDLI